MLVTPSLQFGGDQAGGELAVGGGHGEQPVAENPFDGTALIDVHVCGLWTDHGLVGAQQQAEPQHVGARSGENEEDASSCAEGVAKSGGGPIGPRIGTVGAGVSGIGLHQRTDNRLVRTRMVVAAEALTRVHGPSLERRSSSPVLV